LDGEGKSGIKLKLVPRNPEHERVSVAYGCAQLDAFDPFASKVGEVDDVPV
jgi:hypothetical protein